MRASTLNISGLRSLDAEIVVTKDLARLQIDAAHRAASREVLWSRAEEYVRFGYRRRPWLKALEILSELDKTHPLDRSKEDELIALRANNFLEQITYNADRDPSSWWHSESLWRAFCEATGWHPEDKL